MGVGGYMKKEYMHIRISEGEKEFIKARSEELQMSMSEYLIWLVRNDKFVHSLGIEELSVKEHEALRELREPTDKK